MKIKYIILVIVLVSISTSFMGIWAFNKTLDTVYMDMWVQKVEDVCKLPNALEIKDPFWGAVVEKKYGGNKESVKLNQAQIEDVSFSPNTKSLRINLSVSRQGSENSYELSQLEADAKEGLFSDIWYIIHSISIKKDGQRYKPLKLIRFVIFRVVSDSPENAAFAEEEAVYKLKNNHLNSIVLDKRRKQ